MTTAAATSFTTSSFQRQRNSTPTRRRSRSSTAFGLDIMHVSGSALGDAVMGAKVLRACKALHANGVKISFDPNVRKELIGNPSYFDSVREMIEICSLFLPSEDDAATLFPGRDLSRLRIGILCPRRRLCRPQEGRERLPRREPPRRAVNLTANRVEVQDPTGAGDCFCATFVTLIASGKFSFRQAMERANAAGALAVTKVGPMEGNSRSDDPRRLSGETLMNARDVWRSIIADNRAGEAARHRVLVHCASADAKRGARRPSGRRRPYPYRSHLQPGESARRLHRNDARRFPNLRRTPCPPRRRRLSEDHPGRRSSRT